MTTAVPPLVSGGLPVIGHVLEMMRDREGLFKRGYAEHGKVFSIKLVSKSVAVVSGTEHTRQFFMETDKSLSMQEGYAFMRESFGEVLFIASQETYDNQRPALQEIFRRDRMVGYIQAMNVEVQRWLDSLGQSGEIDLTQAMRKLTQYVVGRALIGPDHEQELSAEFWENYVAIGESLDFVLPPKLPLPKFRRRDRSKKVIVTMLKGVIQKRREHPERYNDVITTLLGSPMKNGHIMSDEEIVRMFMSLLFAGHETTAGQAAWMLALLLRHPDYQQRVQAEIRDHVRYGTPVDAAVLSKLEHTYWAIDETTRLYPSADALTRTATTAIQMGDYEVPAGWQVMVNAANTHHLPETFQNPEQFDPLRFSPERGEGGNPFSIVGFGGGIHKCTGMNFAKNEMAIITALFFQQFEVELLSKDIHVVTGMGANHPSPVMVRYTRKPVSSLTDAATIQEAVAAGCPHMRQQVAMEQSTP
jgi:sterol 14alpha-demethylase